MIATASGDNRRTQILEAALAAFLEHGYAATTIAEIRHRSGATTGSIYHFFSGKGALAQALLEESVAGWSATGVADSDALAEAAIKASVRGLLTWGLANPKLFRFMDEIRALADADEGFSGVAALLAKGQADAAAAYRRFVRQGAVRPLPWPVAHALMLGPAYLYLRAVLNLGGRGSKPAIETLVDAAWEAVAARP